MKLWNRLFCLPLSLVFSMCAGRVADKNFASDEIEEGFKEVNGTRLYYRSKGSGEPIVVLHGGPGFDHQQFLPFIDGLADKYQVILYDQRGTGLSAGPVDADSITIENFIEDIEGIRKAFQIEKLNLLGHSWGGILALHYAIRHPERLKSLILASTAASVDCFEQMQANIAKRRSVQDSELIESIAKSEAFTAGDPQTIEKFWRVYFRAYFVDPSLSDKMNLTFTENTIKHSNAVAGFILKSVGAFDLHDDLKVIKCPTLILHGDSDPMPAEYARKIHSSIKGSKLVILEKSGHWIFVDAEEEFRANIDKFLSSAL